MAGNVKLEGAASTNLAEVNSVGELTTAVSNIPKYVPSVVPLSENDKGTVIAGGWVASPKVDQDYRTRTGYGYLIEEDVFNYTALNTHKFNPGEGTVSTITWTTTGLVLSQSDPVTGNTYSQVRGYNMYTIRPGESLVMSMTMSFDSVPGGNYIGEYGLSRPGAASGTPLGIFFRVTTKGVEGVVSYGDGSTAGEETSTGPLPVSSTDRSPFRYVPNKQYRFSIQANQYNVYFRIRDPSGSASNSTLVGVIPLSKGKGRNQRVVSNTISFINRVKNTASMYSGIFSTTVYDYCIRGEGSVQLGEDGNRIYGAYQGLSGGTMGSLASYANSANPTPGAGSNTAALVTGLGGQVAIVAQTSGTTESILTSSSVAIYYPRIKVSSIRVSAVNMGAVVATTPTTIALAVGFESTNDLTLVEGGGTKGSRRIPLGHMHWPVGSPIGSTPVGGSIVVDFTQSPIYVSPGEVFLVACKFLVGTATASQAIWFTITPVYTWE